MSVTQTMLLTPCVSDKVQAGRFAAANVSFDKASDVMEVSPPRCLLTSLLVGYDPQAIDPSASLIDQLSWRSRMYCIAFFPKIVFSTCLGPACTSNEEDYSRDFAEEMADCTSKTGMIFVVMDCATCARLSLKEKAFWQDEGCSWLCLPSKRMVTNLPRQHAEHHCPRQCCVSSWHGSQLCVCATASDALRGSGTRWFFSVALLTHHLQKRRNAFMRYPTRWSRKSSIITRCCSLTHFQQAQRPTWKPMKGKSAEFLTSVVYV